jgi:alkylation response protein AidB-like acyl-CoA dehydrogenase
VRSDFYGADHELFRETVREFIGREVAPFQEQWEADHLVPRSIWLAAGKQGLLGLGIAEEFGGGGQDDWRFRCVVMEEFAGANATSANNSFGLNEDIVTGYIVNLGTDEQKRRWLPGMAAGEVVTAIAMTEPGAGSDLQGMRATALRDGDHYVLNGSKTFITNGIQSDVVVVAARTDPAAGSRGISLLLVEEGMQGFRRGRKLEKVGIHGQDTAELSFDDVRVPVGNMLGPEGRGLQSLIGNLPKERMSIAWYGLVAAEAALRWTIAYVKDRKAFGRPIMDLQNTRFALAEMTTQTAVTRAYLETSVLALNKGELTVVDAARAKYWATEMQKEITDRCLQLFGGYGYMLEYPIARAYIDARVQTIYGGTTEIMKEIIGRDLAT